MSVQVHCIQCRKQYSVGEHFIGTAVRCKNCGATFVIQAANALAQSDPLLADPLRDLSAMTGNSQAYNNPVHQFPTRTTKQGSQVDAGMRRKWILGVAAASLFMLVGGGIWGVVWFVKREVRRAQVRQMMQDPVWREKVLGEKQGWQTYTDSSPQFGYSVLMPGPPQKQSQGFTAGGPQWILMAHLPQQTFSVVTIQPPLGIDSEQAELVIQGADLVAAGMKSQVTSQRSIALGRFPGVEFDFTSLPGEKSYSGRVRLFATAHMVYQVGWMASPKAPPTGDVTRFLDSFALPATAEVPKAPFKIPSEATKVPSFNFQPPTLEELMEKAATESRVKPPE